MSSAPGIGPTSPPRWAVQLPGAGLGVGGDLLGEAGEDEEHAQRRDHRLVAQHGHQYAVDRTDPGADGENDGDRHCTAEAVRKQPGDEDAVDERGQRADGEIQPAATRQDRRRAGHRDDGERRQRREFLGGVAGIKERRLLDGLRDEQRDGKGEGERERLLAEEPTQAVRQRNLRRRRR